MLKLRYAFICLVLILSLLPLSAQTRDRALAWRSILDYTESLTKEELFDLLLVELFFSADFGFKAKDISYSTAGIPEIGDNPLYMAQGEIIATSNFLDFAVLGNGFFAVETPEGVRYTRNGNFKLNAQGQVVTEEGYAITPSLQVDQADVQFLSMNLDGKTLEIIKDGLTRDLYDFHLFLPLLSDDENPIENSYGLFFFPEVERVDNNYTIQIRSLELSTVKIERILARLSDLLFKIKSENPQGDYEFRRYMLDHLLKSQLQMGQTAQSIKRFSDLIKGVAPLLLFNPEKNSVVMER